MNTFIRALAVLSSAFVTFVGVPEATALVTFGDNPEFTQPPGGAVPKLTVSSSAGSVAGGQTVTLTANVTDTDSTVFYHSWQALSGTFSAVSADRRTVTWRAPSVGTTQRYNILSRVVDTSGNAIAKSIAIVVTAGAGSDTQKPTISVFSLSGGRYTAGQTVNVTWSGHDETGGSGLASHRIEGWNSQTYSWEVIAASISAGSTSYAWTATVGITSIKVSAVDAAGNSQFGTTGDFTVVTSYTEVIPPTPAIWTLPTSTINNYLRLQWSAVQGAQYYEVYIARGDAYSPIDMVPVSSTEFVHGGLENDTYYYKVRAVNTAGTSGWSAVVFSAVNANLPPGAAILPHPVDAATNENPANVTISWDLPDDENGDIVSSRVYFGTDPNNLPSQTGYGLSLDYNVGALLPCQTYYWRIDARDPAGAVTPGPVWRFSTDCAQADIAVVNVQVTGPIVFQGNVQVDVTVQNIGSRAFTGVGTLELYFAASANQLQRKLGDTARAVADLQPGQTTVISYASINLSDWLAKDFYLVAALDPGLYENASTSNDIGSAALTFTDVGKPTVHWKFGLASAGNELRISGNEVTTFDWYVTHTSPPASCDLYYSTLPDGAWTYFATQATIFDNNPPNFTYKYAWLVPGGLIGERVKLKVICVDASANSGEEISAGGYAIWNPGSPVPTVTFPNGGVTLRPNTTYKVTWTISSPNGVKSVNVGAQGCGGSSVIKSGHLGYLDSVDWTTPNITDVSTCRVEVTVFDNALRQGTDLSNGDNSIISAYQYFPPWSVPSKPFGNVFSGEMKATIKADPSGDIHLVVVKDNTLQYKRYFTSTGTWSADKTIYTPPVGGILGNVDTASIELDSSGRPHVLFWVEASGDMEVYHVYNTSGTTWSATTNLSNNAASRDLFGVLAKNSAGLLYAFWVYRAPDNYDVAYRTWNGSTWSARTVVSLPESVNYHPNSPHFVDSSDMVHLLAKSDANKLYDVYGTAATGFAVKYVMDFPTWPVAWDSSLDSLGNLHFVYEDGSGKIGYLTYDGAATTSVYYGNFGRKLQAGSGGGVSIALGASDQPNLFYLADLGDYGLDYVVESRTLANGVWSEPQNPIDPLLSPQHIEAEKAGSRIYLAYSYYAVTQLNYKTLTTDSLRPYSAWATTVSFASSYPVSSQKIVRWISSDDVAVTTQRIYWVESGQTKHLLATLSPSVTTYTWTLPATPYVGVYLLLESQDAAGNVGTLMSPNFNVIESVAPVASVTQPRSGDILMAHQITSVTWTATDNISVDSVDIDYCLSECATYYPIGSLLQNTGSYAWAVPFLGAPSDAKIRLTVRDRSGNVTVAFSPPFQLSPNLANSVSLYNLAPGSGMLNAALTTTLSWSVYNSTGSAAGTDVYFSTNRSLVDTLEPSTRVVTASTAVGYMPALTWTTAYYWRVKVTAGLKSTVSATRAFTTETEYIAPPTNLAISGNGVDQLTLSWTDNSANEAGYSVENSSDGITFFELATVAAGATACTVTGLSPASVYYFRVHAFTPQATSLDSETVRYASFDNPPNTPISIAPADGSVDVALDGATLLWSASDPDGDSLTYRLYFGDVAIAPLYGSGLTVNAASLPSLSPGNIYYWRVVAVDPQGNESSGPLRWFATIERSAPQSPLALEAESYGLLAVRLNWQDRAADESGFVVERRNDDGTEPWNAFAVAPQDVTSVVDPSGMHSGNIYYYQVASFNDFGRSAYSAAVSFTVPNYPPAITPSVPALTLIDTGAFTFDLAYYREDLGDEGRSMVWSATQVPTSDFSAAISGDTLIITPIPGHAVTNPFVLILTDPHGAQVTQAVTVQVRLNTVPAVFALSITPSAPVTLDPLWLSYGFSDADGDPESGTLVRWYRNGLWIPELDGTMAVDSAWTTKGDTWWAEITPSDGYSAGLPVTVETIIQNLAPAAVVTDISPATIKVTGALTCLPEAGTDPDGDPVTMTFQWLRNGTPISGENAETFAAIGVAAKGDSVRCVTRAFDGVTYGAATTSPAAIIVNSEPFVSTASIAPALPHTDDALQVSYSFEDADGDAEAGTVLRWYRNGALVAALDGLRTVPASATSRGESWYFEVIPGDGSVAGAMLQSGSITVQNSVPTADQLTLTPSTPKTLDTLTSGYAYFDADGDPESGTSLQWYENGLRVAALDGVSSVTSDQTVRGAVWWFIVRPSDGLAIGSDVSSQPVTIANTSPSLIAAVLTPSYAQTDALFTCTPQGWSDDDGDVAAYRYQWLRNGSLLLGETGATLAPETTQRSDSVNCIAAPFDGIDEGPSKTSAAVVVANTAPLFVSTPPGSASDGVAFQYSPVASDLDNDALFFVAVTMPLGASIDAGGILRWTPTYFQVGRHTLSLRVVDAGGESALQTFDVEVAYRDNDVDGLPDTWELLHGLNPSNAADAGADTDGDGISNAEEWLFGLDPDLSNAPSVPGLHLPPRGYIHATTQPVELVVNNASDPAGLALTYEFEVFRDAGMTLRTEWKTVMEGSENTPAQTTAATLENTWYYWRVRARNVHTPGPWMTAASFFVNQVNEAPPQAPGLAQPAANAQVASLRPTLEILETSDPDLDSLAYQFTICLDTECQVALATRTLASSGTGQVAWPIEFPLVENQWYYWTVQAIDSEALVSPALGPTAFFINTSNDAPGIPLLEGFAVEITSTTLYAWLSAIDPEGEPLTFYAAADTLPSFNSSALLTAEGVGQPVTLETLQDNTRYFLRYYASDGRAAGPPLLSEVFVNTQNDAPTTPALNNPSNAATVASRKPQFTLYPATDVDHDLLTYHFEIYTDAKLTTLWEHSETVSAAAPLISWLPQGSLINHRRFWWRAAAVDEHGLSSPWSHAQELFVYAGNNLPTAPIAKSPRDGETIEAGATVQLRAAAASDDEGDELTYRFEILDARTGTLVAKSGVVKQPEYRVEARLPADSFYYWRAAAHDGWAQGAWSDSATFQIAAKGIEAPEPATRSVEPVDGGGCSCRSAAGRPDYAWIWYLLGLILVTGRLFRGKLRVG